MWELQRLVGNRATADVLGAGGPPVQRNGPTFTKDRQVTKAEDAELAPVAGSKAVRETRASDADAALGRMDPDLLLAAHDVLGPSPHAVSGRIGACFPAGPNLSGDEFAVIERLSPGREGQAWLREANLMAVWEAEAYLEGHKFHDWLLLPNATKMLLAYIAWFKQRQTSVGTPPYELGRSIEAGDLGQGVPEYKQVLQDRISADLQQSWKATLTGGPNPDTDAGARAGVVKGTDDPAVVNDRNAHAQDILKRVLVMLHANLKIANRDEKGETKYEPLDSTPVIRVLSHGGRVNIRIPKLAEGGPDKTALLRWLGVLDGEGEPRSREGVNERREKHGPVNVKVGTHYVKVGKDRDGKRGSFKEVGGTSAFVKANLQKKLKVYGVDLAVGGMGQRDFNGDVILPDGAHGHLYLGYLKPTHDRDGYLQVGVETTGPHAPSTVGYVHDASSSEATANPMSSFGGMKKDKVGDESSGNARTVDLAALGAHWLDVLEGLRKAIDSEADPVDTLTGKPYHP